MKQEERVLPEWDVYEMAEATALNLSRKGVLTYIVRKKDVMDELELLIRAVEAKVGKMLTCSERQEEQKPIFKKGDRVIWDGEEFNILNVDKDFYNVGGYIVPFSREGELHPIGQKPAEWDFPYGVNETVDKLIAIAECLEMDGDCLFNGYTGTACGKFLRDLARKQVECKPAEWSEEDRKMVDDIIFTGEHHCYLDAENIQWVKSLPERFNLHPKQEWSETGEENKGEMVSPFTGGKVVEEEALTEVEYRGAKYSVPRKYYKCVDTGRQFSTSEQDGDLIWAVFRKYCEERNFDTFRDLLPEGKFSNTAVTNLFETYNNNKDRLQFPHLEIYHSGVMDWCVRIYEQDGIGSGSKENVIVDVQDCDPLYAFAKAESTLKEWLLENKDGY